MKQIPGQLYNLDKVFTVSKEEGAKWHLIQALAGDQTDGYSGVPGIGVKRATSLFEEDGYSWKTVTKAFTDKGLTEYDAITNARLARILTADDYDFKNKQPILWTPTSDYKINS
jgi:DNA polymerase-1